MTLGDWRELHFKPNHVGNVLLLLSFGTRRLEGAELQNKSYMAFLSLGANLYTDFSKKVKTNKIINTLTKGVNNVTFSFKY